MVAFQIFNDEVDAYESWALFLIFVSILILISGVVLLTHKKPDEHAVHHVTTPRSAARVAPLVSASLRRNTRSRRNIGANKGVGKIGDEEEGLSDDEHGEEVLWQVGEDDDEDDEEVEQRLPARREPGHGIEGGEGERERMMSDPDSHHQD